MLPRPPSGRRGISPLCLPWDRLTTAPAAVDSEDEPLEGETSSDAIQSLSRCTGSSFLRTTPTLGSLSLTLWSPLYPHLHLEQASGYDPIALAGLCPKSPSDRKVSTGIDLWTSLSTLYENQGVGGVEDVCVPHIRTSDASTLPLPAGRHTQKNIYEEAEK